VTSELIDSLFSAGDRILTFAAMPVTPTGTPIGYPPLYVHHIHVGRLTGYYDEHWFTSHGDYTVGVDYGVGALSTKGYTTFLPNGYCFHIDCQLPFAVQAIIQDMRSLATASEMSISIQVNFGLALREAAIEPATLVWNEAPHGPFGYSRFAVLKKPTMSWWTMKWPASGTLLPTARLHSHYARHHRLFLVDEVPQNLAFFASHVSSIVHVHESIPPTSAHETMMLLNLSHTEQILSRLPSILCQDNASNPSFMEAATPEHPQPARWARYREFVCTPRKIEKGRIGTFIQLYQTIADPEVEIYPMHTNTWFYMQMPSASTSSDIKAVSYRYATYRTTSIAEPFQNEEFGSCQERPSAADVATYVSDNAVGLNDAVNAHHSEAAAVTWSPAANRVGGAKDRSIFILAVVLSGMTLLSSVKSALVRAARMHALL